MKILHFDSIDSHEHVIYKEQAYAFRHLGGKKFHVKIAVVNPTELLPIKSKDGKLTKSLYLDNVDAFQKIGKKTPFRYHASNEFLSDHSSAARFQYKSLYLDKNVQPPYVVYSADVDFDQPDVLQSVSNFEIDTTPDIIVAPDVFSTYGIVYPLNASDITPNAQAAQQLEIYGRNHPEYSDRYNMLPTAEVDSLGRFVVWCAGHIIRKAAALDSQNNPIHYIRSKNEKVTYSKGKPGQESKRVVSETHIYETLKDVCNKSGKILSAEILKPFENPAYMLNILQTIVYKESGFKYGLFGYNNIQKILPELQARNDDGVRRTAEINAKLAIETEKRNNLILARQQKAAAELLAQKEQQQVAESSKRIAAQPDCPCWKKDLVNYADANKLFDKPGLRG